MISEEISDDPEANLAIPMDLRSDDLFLFEWVRPGAYQLQCYLYRQQPMECWIPGRHHDQQYGNHSDFELAIAVGVRERANDFTALERQRLPERSECDREQLELQRHHRTRRQLQGHGLCR